MQFGVFAHEALHTLGAPDVYDTGYDATPAGDWDLMDSGSYNGLKSGTHPAHMGGPLKQDLKLNAGYVAFITGDEKRIKQVLVNLIGNAIKFTPAHGQITLRATTQPGTVLFSVTDTGIGIPAEDLAHIFDRFWQASQAERRGAGLGLAICKGLVETHGGRLWVESTPAHGSTFSFTIPAAPPRGGRRQEASPPDP